MLRYLVLLIRMKLPRLSRYLERSLATSCDLTPSLDPSASIPAGYEQPQSPPTTSGYQPPSLGPQDEGYRAAPLPPSPSPHLPALEESMPDMAHHLSPYKLEAAPSDHDPQDGPRSPGSTPAVSKPARMAEFQIKSNNFEPRSYKAIVQLRGAKDCDVTLSGPQDEPNPTGHATALRILPPPAPARNQGYETRSFLHTAHRTRHKPQDLEQQISGRAAAPKPVH